MRYGIEDIRLAMAAIAMVNVMRRKNGGGRGVVEGKEMAIFSQGGMKDCGTGHPCQLHVTSSFHQAQRTDRQTQTGDRDSAFQGMPRLIHRLIAGP